MVNENKVKGKVIEIFGTIEKFAEQMGWSSTTATTRMRGEGWKQSEIAKAADVLCIPNKQIPDYFFVSNVEKSTHSEGN